jgi:hypothetical protein
MTSAWRRQTPRQIVRRGWTVAAEDAVFATRFVGFSDFARIWE